MTVKEARELVQQLKSEIEKGIDVEFNTQWVELLNKSILDGVERGYAKAIKSLSEKI